eukprot:967316-Rhodomonas_salina.2
MRGAGAVRVRGRSSRCRTWSRDVCVDMRCVVGVCARMGAETCVLTCDELSCVLTCGAVVCVDMRCAVACVLCLRGWAAAAGAQQ